MGAGSRYVVRSRRWEASGRFGWWYRHQAWWWLHNGLSHPLLGVLPCGWTVWFHDWTSAGLNLHDELRPSRTPDVSGRYWKWFLHNVFGHLAICVPLEVCFEFHDWGSREMGVRGWV